MFQNSQYLKWFWNYRNSCFVFQKLEIQEIQPSEISEFKRLYSTSNKKNYLPVRFSLDILHRFGLPTTPNLTTYKFVSGLALINWNNGS